MYLGGSFFETSHGIGYRPDLTDQFVYAVHISGSSLFVIRQGSRPVLQLSGVLFCPVQAIAGRGHGAGIDSEISAHRGHTRLQSLSTCPQRAHSCGE